MPKSLLFIRRLLDFLLQRLLDCVSLFAERFVLLFQAANLVVKLRLGRAQTQALLVNLDRVAIMSLAPLQLDIELVPLCLGLCQ